MLHLQIGIFLTTVRFDNRAQTAFDARPCALSTVCSWKDSPTLENALLRQHFAFRFRRERNEEQPDHE
ncbi:MAG TPA: hypothetical protein VGL08_01610, partial [Paraburkholderia sp.]